MATERRTRPGDAVQSIQDVTPHDTNEIKSDDDSFPDMLLIGEVDKAITITDLDGNNITFAAGSLAVGVFHRIAFKRVRNTGTDAFTAGTIKAGWAGWVRAFDDDDGRVQWR